MADRLDFSHDIDMTNPARTRLLGFNTDGEGVRTDYGNLTVEELVGSKMSRYILYLVKVGSAFEVRDPEGNTKTFAELLPIIRDVSRYVVMLYGNIKLRPQYVSENEMQFTGVSRDSAGAYTHRVVMTSTRLTYDAIELADAHEVTSLATDLADAKTKLAEQILINKAQSHAIANLNAIADGKIKEDFVEPTENGVLNLPSDRKLAPFAEVDEFEGKTRKSKNLIPNSLLSGIVTRAQGVDISKEIASDGSFLITLNGTVANTTWLALANGESFYKIYLPYGTYTLSDANNNGITLYLRDKTDSQFSSGANKVTRTGDIGYISILLIQGRSFDNTVVKLQLEEGSVATSYEPYFTDIKHSLVRGAESIHSSALMDGYSFNNGSLDYIPISNRSASPIFNRNGKNSFSWKVFSKAGKTVQMYIRELNNSGYILYEEGWTSTSEGVFNITKETTTKIAFVIRYSTNEDIVKGDIKLFTSLSDNKSQLLLPTPIEMIEGDRLNPATGMRERTWTSVSLDTSTMGVSSGIAGARFTKLDNFLYNGSEVITSLTLERVYSVSDANAKASCFYIDNTVNIYVKGYTGTFDIAYKVITPSAPVKVFGPIDNGIEVEAGGSIHILSDNAQAEGLIHYASDFRG